MIDMLEENRRLKRENAELRRVNEVLRAASVLISRPKGRPDPEDVMSCIEAREDLAGHRVGARSASSDGA